MRHLLLTGIFIVVGFAGYMLFSSKTTTPETETVSSHHAALFNNHSSTVEPPPLSDTQGAPTKTLIAKVPGEPQTPTRKKSFDQPYEYFQNRLQLLKSCFDRPCKLPNKDPKSYEYAVYMEIEKTLTTLKDWQARHDFKDERIPLMMRSFLAYEKSEIKVTALEILSTQLKDERVVPHVLQHVVSQAYPTPIPLAMRELGRYKDGKYKKQIEDTILDVLTHGSIYSATEVAKNIKPIVNGQNRQNFQSALDELSQQPLSKGIYTALKSSLDNN